MAIAVVWVGCTAHEPPPEWPVSSPSELCDDPSLDDDAFCMPSARIERWLKTGAYEITDAAEAGGGTTQPQKLRLVVKDGERKLAFSAKFKPAPAELDSFNNSPRREIAAYDMQKLVLDEAEWVVPPTVLACLPLERYRKLLPKVEAFPDTNCALGILAYWVENVTDDDVYDTDRLADDARYRDAIGNLNAVTVLIGHQDNVGSNFLVTEDRRNPRLLAIDNGLAFGAFGVNPFQIVSSAWSSIRVDSMPLRTVERLRKLDRRAFDRLAVVAQLEHRGLDLVSVEPTAPLDVNEAVRRDGGVIQLGLTADEITDVQQRLVGMLGKIESGDLRVSAR
jgi:hypothetical protein